MGEIVPPPTTLPHRPALRPMCSLCVPLPWGQPSRRRLPKTGKGRKLLIFYDFQKMLVQLF
jgi:hypothetical protein